MEEFDNSMYAGRFYRKRVDSSRLTIYEVLRVRKMDVAVACYSPQGVHSKNDYLELEELRKGSLVELSERELNAVNTKSELGAVIRRRRELQEKNIMRLENEVLLSKPGWVVA